MSEPTRDKAQEFKDKGKEFVEQIEVAGDQLVSKVKELLADGSTKRIVVRSSDDKEMFSIPMNVGVVGGGLMALATPTLAAIGAIAALVTKVRIDVVREGEAPTETDVVPHAGSEPDDPAAHI